VRQLELEVRRQNYYFTNSEDKAEESADSLYVCLFLVCSKLSLRWWDCQWWRIVWQVSTVLSLLMVRYYSTAIIHSSSSMYILGFKQQAAGDGERHCNVFLCGFCDKSLTSELMDLCEGQTGSGKTHTMWGPMPGSTSDYLPTEDRGITPRIFEQLFSRIQQAREKISFFLKIPFAKWHNGDLTHTLDS